VTAARRQSRSFLGNLRWGVGIGLVFAALYSLYVAVLFLIVGSEPFDRHHTSVLMVIATYFVGGITGGSVVGVMRPHTHSRFVAIIVGIVAAFFVIFGVAVASQGLPWNWTRAAWTALAVLSILFGSFGGNMIWNNPFDSTEDDR
jgi:hypothetical protein